MGVEGKLFSIGQYEASGSEISNVYMELRGALSQQQEPIILPPMRDIEGLVVEIDLDEAEFDRLLSELAENRPDVVEIANKAKGAEAQAFPAIAFVAVVLGLAVLSKLKYTREGGWEVREGFPDLAAVLDKLKFPA